MKIFKHLVLLTYMIFATNVIARCPEEQRYDINTNGCVSICSPGDHFDPTTQKCTTIECTYGKIWNPKSQTCVSFTTPHNCPKGSRYDHQTRGCVKIKKCPRGQHRGLMDYDKCVEHR